MRYLLITLLLIGLISGHNTEGRRPIEISYYQDGLLIKKDINQLFLMQQSGGFTFTIRGDTLMIYFKEGDKVHE